MDSFLKAATEKKRIPSLRSWRGCFLEGRQESSSKETRAPALKADGHETEKELKYRAGRLQAKVAVEFRLWEVITQQDK
jgi:hypothetical protein